MHTLRTLTAASIKMFLRNRQALFFTLFMPFLIMVIFGLLNFEGNGTIKLGIVTDQPSDATKQFVEKLKQVPAFEISEGDEASQRSALQDGDRDLILVLPNDLIPTGQPSGEPKTITALISNARQIQAQTGLSVMQQVLDQTTLQIVQAPSLFAIETQNVDTRDFRYIAWLLPGIVAIAIMQMSVFSVSFVFVDYKEKGILKRLLATPLKPYQFVGANVITRLLVALVQTGILISLGIVFFKITVAGSWLLIALIAILGAVMFLGLGFAISGFAKTVESVPAVANLIIFPQFFLAETFFPIDNMPGWLATIVHYLPLSYFSTSLRAVITEGAGFTAVAPNLLWMLGWSIALVGLAIYTFSFEEKRVK